MHGLEQQLAAGSGRRAVRERRSRTRALRARDTDTAGAAAARRTSDAAPADAGDTVTTASTSPAAPTASSRAAARRDTTPMVISQSPLHKKKSLEKNSVSLQHSKAKGRAARSAARPRNCRVLRAALSGGRWRTGTGGRKRGGCAPLAEPAGLRRRRRSCNVEILSAAQLVPGRRRRGCGRSAAPQRAPAGGLAAMGKLPWDAHAAADAGDPALRAGRQRGGGAQDGGASAHRERDCHHGTAGAARAPSAARGGASGGGMEGSDAVCDTASMRRGQLPRGRRRPDDTARLRGGWQRRPAAQALMLVCICLLWCSGGGDDSAELQAARLRLADTFDLRKQLSGESTYPHRYRIAGSNCCGGSNCVECQGEKVGNIDAMRLYLESEIRLLRKIGCPCRIEKLSPPGGPIRGGTDVVITVSGLDLDMVLERGPLNCWIRMGLEDYVVRPTSRVLGTTDKLRCRTPPSAPQTSQITLHAADFAITAGSTRYEYFDTRPPRLFSIVPSGAPSAPGGAVLTVTGSGFRDAVSEGRSLSCVFGTVAFDADVRSNETAVCVAPAGMSPAKGKLFISYNAQDPAGTDTVDFAVFNQPRIAAIWPTGGFGNEPIMIQAAGLESTYRPREGDINCLFVQQHQEKVVPATRVGNSSTVTCIVPNNTRDDHIVSGEVRVEITLLGEPREVSSLLAALSLTVLPALCVRARKLEPAAFRLSMHVHACISKRVSESVSVTVSDWFRMLPRRRCTRITAERGTAFILTAAVTAIFFTQPCWPSSPTALWAAAAQMDTFPTAATA